MEIRKLTLSLLWASASFATAMAQYTGVILDPEKQPLEYANVALLHPQDSTLIAGGMTDSDGSFCISTKESPIIVRVSYPGYNPFIAVR